VTSDNIGRKSAEKTALIVDKLKANTRTPGSKSGSDNNPLNERKVETRSDRMIAAIKYNVSE